MPYPGEYRGSPYFYGSGTRAPTIVRRRPAVSPRGGGYEPPFSLGIGPGGNADPSRRGGGYVAPSGIPSNIPGLPQGPQGPAASSLGDYLGQARSMYDPVLRAAADAINRRTELGMGAIGQYTGQLVGMAGQYAGLARQAYQPEIEQGRAVSGWALNALSGAGRNAQVDYKAATRQSGFDPNVQKSGLQQMGKDAGQAAYGIGNAYVDALVASQTASVNRASQEPTWAAGLGEQAKTLLAIQSARALSDQEAQIAAQIPELALNLRSQDIQQSQYAQDYGLRQRELADQEAAQRAGIVGPRAPTEQGRLAYWQGVADKRTQDTGQIWVASKYGIRSTGQLTAGERSNRIGQILTTGYDPATGQLTAAAQRQLKALGYNTGGGMSASQVVTLAREDQRHNEAMNRLQIQQQNANTAQERAAIAQAVANERARHNTWIEQHPGRTVRGQAGTGSAPRRVGPNMWKTRTGAPLGPVQKAYWEALYQAGYINNTGKILHPIPPGWKPGDPAYGGSGGGGLGGVAVTPK